MRSPLEISVTYARHSLTHGYQTAKKKISSSSIYFTSMPYQADMVR